ncbi:TonB-dependent receptor [Chitinophaga barathri]|uniref:SusC/RagA family TonB-linked outer membrane protein n=1 Tax=Chitinophaga barathri TaxID=1647451 RepID=A0A3N4MIU1_9BACT|nr:TonB-dependent receptor [Chitinophaga barathri]RPD40020.1 SusC/RagA family TonB-linked outer membrane protein [Chitinophaga barathri]
MKFALALLLAVALQATAANGYAQNITINEKNAPLEKILKLIRAQSGYDFMYDKDLISKIEKIDLQVKNVTVQQAMQKCLAGLPLSFYIDDRMIIIKKKETPVQQAADSTITGRVVDDKNGEAVIGASVMVKGSGSRAVTDQNGNFKIAAAKGAVIVISFIGYEKKETIVNGPEVVVKISPSTESMREVVVTGYGEVRRRDLTGSIASVKMADFHKAPVRSFEEALAGRVAGVQVSSVDGQPGADMKVVIRGNNSVTQDNSPLYVIDGFPMESSDNNAINPAEITSIEILKDASATAIYGARGANGVVIITTRKGREGPPVITYNGYYGIQQNIRRMDLLDPYEFVKYQVERDSSLANPAYLANGKSIESYRNVPGLDLQDEIFRVQPMQNHFISISGGTKTTKYSISGSYLNQDGVIVNTGYDRFQGRMNLEQAINDHFRIGVNANLSHLEKFGTMPAVGRETVFSTNLMYSVWGYRPVPGNSGSTLIDEEVDDVVNGLADMRFNPLYSVKNEHRKTISDVTLVNAYAEYMFGKYVTLRVTGGMTKEKIKTEAFNNSKTAQGSPMTQSGKNYGVNGSVNFLERNSYLNENTLTFNKALNSSHRLNAVAGFTVQSNKSSLGGYAANMVPNEALGIAGLREGTPVTVNSGASSSALASFLGRVNYTFRDKYLLTASFRADGSSRFSDGNKWGFFPSGSVAWRINEEDFMKPLAFISNAKLRVSYGVTGNNRVSDFAYLSAITLPAATAYSFNNQPVKAAILSELGTQSLRWESTRQTDVGLDLGFFNQRLTLETDIYKKVTSDLLLDAKVPTSIGFTNAFKNIGEVQNAGVEFTLNGEILDKTAFKWNAGFNISFNRNKVLQLAEGQQELLSILLWNLDFSKVPLYTAEVGGPIAQYYGYLWEGNYQYNDFNETSPGVYVLKDGVPTYHTNRATTRPGDIKYRDYNGDGKVNSEDRTVIGNPNPDYTGGFTNNFSWKGFDLNVFFQFAAGQEIFNANRIIFEGGGRMHQNMFATYKDRWTPENQNNTYFRTNGYGPTDFGYSSRVVEDGSYLRLKTVALGYNFPAQLLKSIKISSLRIYASAQNLLTWTKYSGFDPEVSAYDSALTPGFDYSVYPRARTITFGLNMTL